MSLQFDHPPGIEHRRARQREEARRAILDATEFLLIESGGFDFSIRSLSKRCGYSAPTVYHYFGDKDGLIDALLEERVAGLADAIERVPVTRRCARGSARGAARVRRVRRRASDLRPPDVDRVEQGPAAAPLRRWSGSPRACARRSTRSRESGRLGGDDVETAGQMIWALLHGLSALRVTEPDHPWAPNLGERALETLLRGMTRPESEAVSR